MKPEPIHYVCAHGAQADTPPLQYGYDGILVSRRERHGMIETTMSEWRVLDPRP